MTALARLRAVAIKELRQLGRDRLSFGMIVGIPAMQIVLFGYAINFDVRDLDTGERRMIRDVLGRRAVRDLPQHFALRESDRRDRADQGIVTTEQISAWPRRKTRRGAREQVIECGRAARRTDLQSRRAAHPQSRPY